jgi:two-component system OmpR family response regulator
MPGGGPGAVRLLVVEDEQTILELLSGSLRFAGFDVVTAASGAEALRAVAASRPDLVLLDVMIPDGDGFEVVRRMRSSGPYVPVIFLTARDRVPDRVAGLALGADDYVTKPFSLDEVMERVRAVLRRAGRPAAATRLRVADLELDGESHEIRRDGTLVALTPTEFRLLQFLMLNAGHVLSKGQIFDQVWGHNPASPESVVEPCVSYLRRKVDQVEPRLIHTIRGVGYVMRIPPP